MTIGGIELAVLITYVATGFLAFAILAMVALAFAPHLSSEWGAGHGAITTDLDGVSDADDAETA